MEENLPYRYDKLSCFEILKAFLLHQVYSHMPINSPEGEKDLEEVQHALNMAGRYLQASGKTIGANQLLESFCRLFYNVGCDPEMFRTILDQQENKMAWIKTFTARLAEYCRVGGSE